MPRPNAYFFTKAGLYSPKTNFGTCCCPMFAHLSQHSLLQPMPFEKYGTNIPFMEPIKIILVMILSLPVMVRAQDYPLHIMEEGHLIVSVQLADSITGNFVLDTGAGATVLSGKTFDKIAPLSRKKGYFTGFRHDGDRLDGTVYEIPSLAIGEYRQSKPLVGVYPPLDAMGIDGLLSLKFFEHRPFSIDFKNRSITFVEPEKAASLAQKHITVPLELYRHTNILLDIFLPITLNGTTEVLAEFDTGSGYDAYIVNTAYLNDLNLDMAKATTQAYRTQLSNQARTDTLYTLNAISLGGANDKVETKEVTTIFREGLIYNALIGSGLFRDRTITIDIPNRVFIVHR